MTFNKRSVGMEGAYQDDGFSDEEIDAAYRHVGSLVKKSDGNNSFGAPFWYGWALRESFLAGIKSCEQRGQSD